MQIVSFQAGEFFSSAKITAATHQRELEVQNTIEASIDNPLLLEQVRICNFQTLFYR